MKSFTLIEVLVVIAVIFIVVALVVVSYRPSEKNLDLNSSTEKIINALMVAQNKTLASEGASQYGVYFDLAPVPHQYILFKGGNYASRDTSFDQINKVPESVEIYNLNLGGGAEIVFNRIIGDTSQAGDLSLRLVSDASKTKTIYIENSGKINLGNPISPTDSRIKDSRHVHFNLGWSIQNATILKFSFPDIPQTEQITMADYFDIAKTEFDWEGSFSVGGTDQIFRIHTHSLDVSNTLLCINRDRNQGKTNQEVIIYIIDGGVEKEIAHYLDDAQDTVTEGDYGGTKEIQ